MSDRQPTLAFGSLPEPVEAPTPAPVTTAKPSAVKQIVDGNDWQAYEDKVLQAVRYAVQGYGERFRDMPEERVFQISIWTDPQVQRTAINFETKEHAKQHVASSAHFWRETLSDEMRATAFEKLEYNGNPADFKHTLFLVTEHPELAGLEDLNFARSSHRHAADARISASLRRVMKRVISEGILSSLPREELIWIGVNSPRDWYDHVRKA